MLFEHVLFAWATSDVFTAFLEKGHLSPLLKRPPICPTRHMHKHKTKQNEFAKLSAFGRHMLLNFPILFGSFYITFVLKEYYTLTLIIANNTSSIFIMVSHFTARIVVAVYDVWFLCSLANRGRALSAFGHWGLRIAPRRCASNWWTSLVCRA